MKINILTRLFLTAPVLLGLIGCRDDDAASKTGEGVAGLSENCAKAIVEPLIGEPREALASVTLPAPVREITPGTMVTKDFRPNRTNIDIDDQGRIVRAWCG